MYQVCLPLDFYIRQSRLATAECASDLASAESSPAEEISGGESGSVENTRMGTVECKQ